VRDGHRTGSDQSRLQFSGFTVVWDRVRSTTEQSGVNPDIILEPQLSPCLPRLC